MHPKEIEMQANRMAPWIDTVATWTLWAVALPVVVWIKEATWEETCQDCLTCKISIQAVNMAAVWTLLVGTVLISTELHLKISMRCLLEEVLEAQLGISLMVYQTKCLLIILTAKEWVATEEVIQGSLEAYRHKVWVCEIWIHICKMPLLDQP